MRIKFKDSFKEEFSKDWYEVIVVSEDLSFYKVINDENEEDWCGEYMVEEVEL